VALYYIQEEKKNTSKKFITKGEKKMGLDMYFHKNSVKTNEIMYWRKANAIHRYFCKDWDGEDNCVPIPVSIESILKLKNICDNILTMRTEENFDGLEDYCKTELPSTVGFFFGSYEYDDWYFNDVQRTYDFLNELTNDEDWKNHEYFYYAWY